MLIRDGEVIDAYDLVGPGLGVERGSRGFLQSVIGHHADVVILDVGYAPITLDVSAQYYYTVWQSAR